MAHGQPDYGLYAAKETTYAQTDVAELAARLGSIVTFDRKGDIIWLDSFENGLAGWVISGAGTGYSVSETNKTARNGSFSAELICGSDAGRRAELWKYLPYPILGNLGLEVSFTVHGDTEWLQLLFRLFDGTSYIQGQLQYDKLNTRLRYLGDDGNWHDLQTSLDLYTGFWMFHTIKVTIDFQNSMYVKAKLDEHSWDMSALPIYTTGSPALPHLFLLINYQGSAGNNPKQYIDDVIVTQNES